MRKLRSLSSKLKKSLKQGGLKVKSRVSESKLKVFLSRKSRHKITRLQGSFKEGEDKEEKINPPPPLKPLKRRCYSILMWCKQHPRIIIVGTISACTVTVLVLPESRLIIIKGSKSILKALKQLLTQDGNTTNLDIGKDVDPASTADKLFSWSTLIKFAIPVGMILFTIFIQNAGQSSSDLEDTGEVVAFVFEDSSESVKYATKSSGPGSKISVVSITSVLTTSVNYIGSAGASVVAFANSALLSRLGMPVKDTNDTSGLATLLLPEYIQLDWLLSSRPWQFISHQKPIMILLNLMGFQIPKLGPYPLSEIMLYHPSFNIYSDVSPEYSPWNWGIMLRFWTTPTDELDDVIGPIFFSLLWDDYTLDDLGSLHPYMARFLRD